jgi:hypothetical protein
MAQDPFAGFEKKIAKHASLCQVSWLENTSDSLIFLTVKVTQNCPKNPQGNNA